MAYQLLPFRFERFNENEYLLTNEVGEYIFLQNDDFYRFVNGDMDECSNLWRIGQFAGCKQVCVVQ